jgi:hypothetical protein
MREKIHDQWGIKMLQTELGRPQVSPLAGEGEQQLQRIGVARAGMGTGAALKRQPFPEKNRDMGAMSVMIHLQT